MIREWKPSLNAFVNNGPIDIVRVISLGRRRPSRRPRTIPCWTDCDGLFILIINADATTVSFNFVFATREIILITMIIMIHLNNRSGQKNETFHNYTITIIQCTKCDSTLDVLKINAKIPFQNRL